jgi:hypothetical protein
VPTVIIEGYKFRFYSSDMFEPPHVHVLRDESEANVWLQPVVLQHNHGYSQSEMNRILRIIRMNQDRLLEVWNDYFNRENNE